MIRRPNPRRVRDYVEVKDVNRNIKKTVNLVGVIVEFSIPRRSEGTDYCVTLKLIDKSQLSPELGISVFLADIDHLPHIRSHSDIILLSSVRIELRRQQAYVVFDKSCSSFALYDGKDTNSFNHYQASLTFNPLNSDKELIRQLRDWSLSLSFDAGVSGYVRPLKDMEKGHFDLVCKVLYVYEVSKNMWMLFVWDGTDAPTLSLNMSVSVEEQNPLPLHIEPDPMPTNVLREFPHVGTVLRVIADKAYKDLRSHFHYAGNWARIRNIYCEPQFSGLWKGILTPQTKIRPLPGNDKSVVERLRDCHERIVEWGRVPLSCMQISNYLTAITDYEGIEHVTLMDLLTFQQGYGKFKCVVRVVAVLPSQEKDFRSSDGLYRIRMTLEDPTGRMHAVLCGEHAELFFRGYPTVDAVASQMKKVLGVPEGEEDAPRNPPWIRCCLEMHASEEGDASGLRHFHMCDTWLV